jgi:hypothetical protein
VVFSVDLERVHSFRVDLEGPHKNRLEEIKVLDTFGMITYFFEVKKVVYYKLIPIFVEVAQLSGDACMQTRNYAV